MINQKGNLIWLVVIVISIASAIIIFGCSDSTSPETGEGQMKITMVDSPAGFDQVNIVVTRVEVHSSGSDSTSDWFAKRYMATYDLLKLRNGASVVLGNHSLDAGHYSQIRLIIGTGSNIVVNGVIILLKFQVGSKQE